MDNKQTEVWKDVAGYEGYYQISDSGKVRSLDRIVIRADGVIQIRKGREKRQYKDKDGYMKVKLSKGGVDKSVFVHKIVASAFLESPDYSSAEVNHIDFDRSNNAASNLEYVSHQENIAYTMAHNRHASQRDLSGSNNPNYGNRTLHERYQSDRAYAVVKQGRPGSSNGRARAVEVSVDAVSWMRFPYIAACAKYLIENKLVTAATVNGVSTAITKAATSGRTYSDLLFRFQSSDNVVPSSK